MVATQQHSAPPGFLKQAYVPQTSARFRFLRFIVFLLLPPALLYFAMFPLVRVAGFRYESWGLSKWGPVLNFPFQARHLDADVVIFGDSTAFLGIDPRIINHETGLKTLVLPNTIGSLPVTNDLALERYLQHNKAPRLIVLYFGSWNLNYGQSDAKRLYFEGEEMLLRNGSWSDIRAYVLRHPIEALAFPLQLNSTIGLDNLKEALHGKRSVDVLNTLGHRDYTEPWPALPSRCVIPEKYIQQTGASSVQALVDKYKARNLNVAVYLAPLPNCANSSLITGRSFAAIAAGAPDLLPAANFASDGFYGHLRPAAVPAASTLFAEALRSRPDMAPAFHPQIRRSAAGHL